MAKANLEQQVPAELPAAPASMSSPHSSPLKKPPFFVLGSQRSGTTMLRLMLNNHRNLCIPHETGFITDFYAKVGSYGDIRDADVQKALLQDISGSHHVSRGKLISQLDEVLGFPIVDYRSLVDAIFQAHIAQFDKPRWGDKTPSYTEDIDILRQIFPDAKFIHLVRDGRDVLVSQKNIEWFSRNVVRLIRDWQWKVSIAHKVGRVLGDDFLEVRYEDLIREPEDTLRTLCAFLDEDYDPDMMSYNEVGKDTVPAESIRWHKNSIALPNPNKIGAWKTKLSTSEKILFDDIAGDTLELFGYEREKKKHNILSLASLIYYEAIRRY